MKKTFIIVSLLLILMVTGCSFGKKTIDFNTNGGSLIESQKVNQNERVTKPVDPTKKGYIFMGWQHNGKDYDFNEKVTESIILDAVWKSDGSKVTYLVTFDIDGDKSSKEVDIGGCAPEPTTIPSKSGCSFKGWYLQNASTPYDFETVLTNDVTIVAKFSDNEEDESSNASKITIYVTNIEATVEKSTIMIGETTQINVSFSPNSATYKEVSYTSSEPKIVSISSSGIVKGLKVGSSIIKIATTDGSQLEKQITVTVTDVSQ